MIKVGDNVWTVECFMVTPQKSFKIPFLYLYRYPKWIVVPVKRRIIKKDSKFYYYGDFEGFRIKKNQCFKTKREAERAVRRFNKKEKERFIISVAKEMNKNLYKEE